MTDDSGSPADRPDDHHLEGSNRLRDALVTNAFHVIAIVSAVATESNLSLTQLRMLAILRDREPTMSALARLLGVDRSSVTGLIDRATERGLVRRLVDADDQRVTRIALTDEGKVLALAGAEVIRVKLEPVFEALDEHERAALTAMLERLLENGASRYLGHGEAAGAARSASIEPGALIALSYADLKQRVDALARDERLISDVRRSLQIELDGVRRELVERIRAGEMDG